MAAPAGTGSVVPQTAVCGTQVALPFGSSSTEGGRCHATRVNKLYPMYALRTVCVTVLRMQIGYARVSNHEQNLDLQLDALKQAGCDPAHIYTDTVSGSSPGLERPGLGKALDYARAGDQLVIWRLDRLARSLKDLLEQVNNLEQQDIELVSLQEKIDTTTPAGRALFQMCGVMAEFERNLISERTKAGLQAARARGRKGGRRRKVTQAKLERAGELMREKRLTVREIARLAGVSTNTLYRYITPDGKLRTIFEKAKVKGA